MWFGQNYETQRTAITQEPWDTHVAPAFAFHCNLSTSKATVLLLERWKEVETRHYKANAKQCCESFCWRVPLFRWSTGFELTRFLTEITYSYLNFIKRRPVSHVDFELWIMTSMNSQKSEVTISRGFLYSWIRDWTTKGKRRSCDYNSWRPKCFYSCITKKIKRQITSICKAPDSALWLLYFHSQIDSGHSIWNHQYMHMHTPAIAKQQER